MNNEFFGVFGSENDFRKLRSPTEFDRVVEGGAATVGVRDVAQELPSRTTVHSDDDGACALWGEVFMPQRVSRAEWFLEQYRESGTDALSELNGSFLAFVDDGQEALVATDPVRSWDCYYADTPFGRVFGTDPAAVAKHIPAPEVDGDPLLEFLHLGTALGDRTVVSQLGRIPFDGCLEADATRTLDRFVYEPEQFDYVDELARRLERAARRRATVNGRKGLLLSGGYDSRLMLACVDDIDVCYTVGSPESAEVQVAKRIASQYGADHRALPPDESYLNVEPDTVQYGHGIRESLHIHHAGYDDQIDVDTMYHGLLCDTYLRGHFLPRDTKDVFGHPFPRGRLDPDPDPAETLSSKLGYMPESDDVFPNCDRVDADDSEEYVHERIRTHLDDLEERYDSTYNAISLLGIQNQPSMSFRSHLADNYVESFLAADAELLDWHLRTPPEHRNTRTFLAALRKIDPNLLRHRPPDRPHDSHRLNQVEKFLRRKLPVVSSFGSPWPDRRELYERADLDRELFFEYPAVHDLPPRIKLRINDVTTWLDLALDEKTLTPEDALCPSGTA